MNPPAARIAALMLTFTGAAVLALGLFLGFGSVNRGGVNCGNAFGGVDRNRVDTAELTATMEGTPYLLATAVGQECDSAVSDRRPLALGVTAVAAVLLVGSLVAATWRGASGGAVDHETLTPAHQ